MLQAVHVIHEENIVHFDLKPANFVLVRGQLKLIDFGIANAVVNDTTNIQLDYQIGSYRAPRWHGAPQSWQAERCMVARLYTLSDGLRLPVLPAPLGLPVDEGDPGRSICY